MPDYKCYFWHSDGHIIGVERLWCSSSDDAARRHARALTQRMREHHPALRSVSIYDCGRQVSHEPIAANSNL